jgi:hypothetical protein
MSDDCFGGVVQMRGNNIAVLEAQSIQAIPENASHFLQFPIGVSPSRTNINQRSVVQPFFSGIEQIVAVVQFSILSFREPIPSLGAMESV